MAHLKFKIKFTPPITNTFLNSWTVSQLIFPGMNIKCCINLALKIVFPLYIAIGGVLVLKDIETVYVNKDFKLKITNSVSDIYSAANC